MWGVKSTVKSNRYYFLRFATTFGHISLGILLENCGEADSHIGILDRLVLKALFPVRSLEADGTSQGIGKLSNQQDLSLDDIFVRALSLVSDNPAGPIVSLIVDRSR